MHHEQETKRRDWLLGVVGAMFGAGAAKAVERWLPAKGVGEPATLTVTERFDQGGLSTHVRPAEGRVMIEYDSRDGALRVAEFDRDGNLVSRASETVRSVTLSLRTAATRSDVAALPHGVVVTHTYDSMSGRTDETRSGQLTYLTYTGGKLTGPEC